MCGFSLIISNVTTAAVVERERKHQPPRILQKQPNKTNTNHQVDLERGRGGEEEGEIGASKSP